MQLLLWACAVEPVCSACCTTRLSRHSPAPPPPLVRVQLKHSQIPLIDATAEIAQCLGVEACHYSGGTLWLAGVHQLMADLRGVLDAMLPPAGAPLTELCISGSSDFFGGVDGVDWSDAQGRLAV